MGGVFFDLLVFVGLFSSKLKRTHLNRRDKNGVLQEEVQMTAKHLPAGRTKPHMGGVPFWRLVGWLTCSPRGLAQKTGVNPPPPSALGHFHTGTLSCTVNQRAEERNYILREYRFVCMRMLCYKDKWAEHDSLEFGGFPLKIERWASCSLKLFTSDKF